METENEPTAVDSAARRSDWEKLDALLEELPPGIPILPKEDAGNFERYTNPPPHTYTPGDGWKNCARSLEEYDSKLLKGFRDEIDTLLVFAGLFSAVVTAFTIESYKWLQTDTTDAMMLLLAQIAQSVSENSPAVSPTSASGGLSGSVSVRINIYWFLALALSLSAALVAILCKQWIREFENNVDLDPKEFVRIHHTKLEGLQQWKVGGIIAILPLLLQLALAMFALGALELLWQLHSVVAVVVCVPAIIAVLFYAATTLLPVIQHHCCSHRNFYHSKWDTISLCPYKSPQTMLAFRVQYIYHRVVQTTLDLIARLLPLALYHIVGRLGLWAILSWLDPASQLSRWHIYVSSWNRFSWMITYYLDQTYDVTSAQPLSLYRSLRWISLNLNDGDIAEWIWRCLSDATEERKILTRSSEESLRRGICYVSHGHIFIPPVELRALALGYLPSTSAPQPFVVEACVQHMKDLDPASAEYLTQQMCAGLNLRIDPQAAVTITRVASEYVRLHLHDRIENFIVHVTTLVIDCSDPQLRSVLSACTLTLYLGWLATQPEPVPFSIHDATETMAVAHCTALLRGPEDYVSKPEDLRRRHRVQELARLVSIYAESQQDPVTALAASVSLTAKEIDLVVACTEDEIRPIIRELLDIAREGVVQDGAEIPCSAADSGALAPRTASSSLPGVSSPTVPDVSSAGQPPVRLTEDEAPSPARRGSAPPGAQALGLCVGPIVGAVGGQPGAPLGASSGPGPQDSSTVRAVLDHASGGDMPSLAGGDGAEEEALRPTHEQQDEEASGQDSGSDLRPLQRDGTSGEAGLGDSPALLAVIVHSLPGASNPRLHGDDGVTAARATDGVRGGNTSGDHIGMDESRMATTRTARARGSATSQEQDARVARIG